MQKIATKVFICASIAFGIIGIVTIVTTPPGGDGSTALNIILIRLLQSSVVIILTSFALSIAGKYLNAKS